MYIPLHARLTFFFGLVLALAIWFFGDTVYRQAELSSYNNLDKTLSERAANVRFGKGVDNLGQPTNPTRDTPLLLPGVDSYGNDGVSIRVYDTLFNIYATTSDIDRPELPGITDFTSSPEFWDEAALKRVMNKQGSIIDRWGFGSADFTWANYQGQRFRVYTLLSDDFRQGHVIQAVRSTKEIEDYLSSLRTVLSRGAALMLFLALAGGWLMTWSVMARVRRITQAAQSISASHDFSKRVIHKQSLGRDELGVLADTFNGMLTSLEKAYQQQQRFVADASHELRAPITSIRCNLDLLAKAPDLPPEEVEAALADTRTEAERMGRLVSDLLLLAHADETKKQKTTSSLSNGARSAARHEQTVDLDSLLLEIYRQYKPLEEHEIDGRRHQGPRLLLQHTIPVKAYGKEDQLKQAIVALVDNAFKYTPQEGYIALALHIVDNEAVIKVSDTGIGITEDDLDHIFERFYRADRARTRDRGSSGLGLSIVQSIVEAHHGTIEVESKPGKGSCFTLKIPAVHSC